MAGVILGIVAGLVYFIVGPNQVDTDSHWPIAQAFVAGRLHLVDAIPWVELVPRTGWRLVLALPAAAVGAAGTIRGRRRAHLDRCQRSGRRWRLGRADVGASWAVWMWRRCPGSRSPLAWAFGSELLWVAGTGGQHLAPQALAAALLLGAMLLGFDRRWPLAGGAAAGRGCGGPIAGRPGTAAAALPVSPRRLGVGAGRASLSRAAIVAGYNLARFGDAFEFGYGLIADVDGNRVLDESWYPHGIDSIWYIPQGLQVMLLKGVEWRDELPWILPGWGGTSILLTMPILWWVFEARGRLALVTAIVRRPGDAAQPGARQPGLRPGRLPLHRRRAAACSGSCWPSRSGTA